MLAFQGPLDMGAIWLSICRCQNLADIQLFASGWTSLAKCGPAAHIWPQDGHTLGTSILADGKSAPIAAVSVLLDSSSLNSPPFPFYFFS